MPEPGYGGRPEGSFGGSGQRDSGLGGNRDRDIADRFAATFGGGFLTDPMPGGLLGNPRGQDAGFAGGGFAPEGGGGGNLNALADLLRQFQPAPPPPIPDFQFMGQPQSFMPQIAPSSMMGAPPMNLQQLYQMYGAGPAGIGQGMQQPTSTLPSPATGDWLLNRRF